MTEAEWLTLDEPEPMLDYIKKASSSLYSGRKMRLFMCACCLRISDQLPPGLGRTGLEVAERLAEGQASEVERKAASSAVWSAIWKGVSPPGQEMSSSLGNQAFVAVVRALGPIRETDDLPARTAESVRFAVAQSVGKRPWGFGLSPEQAKAGGFDLRKHQRFGEMQVWTPAEVLTEAKAQAVLLHDIFGHLPFRSLSLDPAWLAWNDAAVMRLTQAAYDQRLLPSGHLDPACLLVLADSLEEAGCADSNILSHLRDPGPHVRGCHVVDALLGKA